MRLGENVPHHVDALLDNKVLHLSSSSSYSVMPHIQRSDDRGYSSTFNLKV
jgi:hypothetical protein